MFSTLVENQTNYDLFRGKEIVPEFLQKRSPERQYYPDTPEVWKQVGNLLKVSPLKVQFSVENLLGSVPGNIIDTRELLLNGFANEGYKKVPDDKFEHWSQIPVINSFIRTSNYRTSPSEKEMLEASEQRQADLMGQVYEQTLPYVRSNDIESIKLYFEKNAGAFANPNEMTNAINNVMKRLIENQLPQGNYEKYDGEALYYSFYEDYTKKKKTLQQITVEALRNGASKSEVNKMIIHFLSN
jgi:hypothetical protein